MFVRQRRFQQLDEHYHARLEDLKKRIAGLRHDLDGTDLHFGMNTVSFKSEGLFDRVKRVEEKVDLLMKHFGLCKETVLAKTKLKRCK